MMIRKGFRQPEKPRGQQVAHPTTAETKKASVIGWDNTAHRNGRTQI
ncbi:MAG: hypothetical protein J5680_00890 [Neisseriaceae bacterium]|nr:hypothetical protein [Neisseriaceae bacterium]